MSADMQQRQNRSWYFYLSEISLRRTSAGIIQELGGFRNVSATNALITLFQLVPIWEAQLAEWKDNLSRSVSLSSPQEEDDICRFVLRGHLLDPYEMIYWPLSLLSWTETSTNLKDLIKSARGLSQAEAFTNMLRD